jgi:hypothetical protein
MAHETPSDRREDLLKDDNFPIVVDIVPTMSLPEISSLSKIELLYSMRAAS